MRTIAPGSRLVEDHRLLPFDAEEPRVAIGGPVEAAARRAVAAALEHLVAGHETGQLGEVAPELPGEGRRAGAAGRAKTNEMRIASGETNQGRDASGAV